MADVNVCPADTPTLDALVLTTGASRHRGYFVKGLRHLTY
jgi:hypothetical protein